MSAQQLNDLYQQLRAGNPGSERLFFEYLTARFRLFARHRIAVSDDADEVVQEALTIIGREFRSLRVECSFSAWAYKVLDNRVLSYLQSQRTRRERVCVGANIDIVAGPNEDTALRRQLLDCLRRICLVNRRYGRVLVLHAQGYGTEEICNRIGSTQNTLYSLLYRGRLVLRRCLETGEVI